MNPNIRTGRYTHLGFYLDKWVNTIQYSHHFRTQYGSIEGYFDHCAQAASAAVPLGSWLEFGVCTGNTVKELSVLMPPGKTMYGFDSFEGLPEDWDLGPNYPYFREGETFGTTPGHVPEIERCEMVVGLFEDTLPTFAKNLLEPVALLHIDCDLYNSTKTIFKYLEHKIIPGTVILFDEFHNYPNFREGEHKAFKEFIEKTKYNFEFLAITDGEQAAIQILPSDFKTVNKLVADNNSMTKTKLTKGENQ